MIRCYLGLGSNLNTPIRQLQLAISALKKLPHSHVVQVSDLSYTQPLGTSFQPMYCNAVLALDTTLSPLQLLNYCQLIEQQQGRIRKKRWGSRTLDIDLLLYGDIKMQHKRLTLPHPGMLNRDFVMKPLANIMAHLNTNH